MMRMNLHFGQQCLPVNVVPSIAFTWLADNGERAYSSVRRKQMGGLLRTAAKTAVRMLAGHYRINRSGAMIRGHVLKNAQSAHFRLLPGSKPTCKTLKACRVQYISQGWLASWLVYRAGNPCTMLRMRNCM